MPRPATEYTGRDIDRVTVERRHGSTPRGRAVWACRCRCGRECLLTGDQLANGVAACPDCHRAERVRVRRDMTTEPPFGRLTVVGRVGEVGRRTLWRCECECGKTCDVWAGNLASGRTRSCGCLHDEQAALNVMANRRSGIGKAATCPVCGGEFVKDAPPQRYCSDSCRAIRNATARQVADNGEPATQMAKLRAGLEGENAEAR